MARDDTDAGLVYAGRVELVDARAGEAMRARLKPQPSSPLGWRTRRVSWVRPDVRVVVRALASGPGLREGRIVALAD